MANLKNVLRLRHGLLEADYGNVTSWRPNLRSTCRTLVGYSQVSWRQFEIKTTRYLSKNRVLFVWIMCTKHPGFYSYRGWFPPVTISVFTWSAGIRYSVGVDRGVVHIADVTLLPSSKSKGMKMTTMCIAMLFCRWVPKVKSEPRRIGLRSKPCGPRYYI